LHVDFQLHSLSGLFARAGSLRDEYASAKPWPHIVINDAFPEKLLDMVAAECTALPEAPLITTNTDRLVKQEISDGLGPATQHLLSLIERPQEALRRFIVISRSTPRRRAASPRPVNAACGIGPRDPARINGSSE